MYALQAIGEIVVPAVVDAGPVGDDAQIDIAALGPLALVEAPAPEPFVRRGHRLAEHMRDAKARKSALQQLAEKTKEAEQKDEALQRITRVLPSAAQMLGTVRSSAVGRLQKTEPDHFTVAVRAMHLPARRKVKAGVDVKKLICCGAKIISKRQKVGMAKCLGNAKKVLAHRVDGPRRHVHVNHLHMWDEVACKFRWRPSKKYRQQRKATRVPMLVQRGVVSFGLSHRVRKVRRLFREPWLSKPSAVNGTKAKDLFPGICRGTPEELQLVDLQQMRKLMAHTSTFTHMPLGDQASSNVLMMKYEGHFWESHLLPAFGGRILLWPDHCAVHAHHNGKKQVKALKAHTLRHFSITGLMRDQRTQVACCTQLENLVVKKHRRRVDLPPQGVLTLHAVVDVLIDFGAEHHKRKNGFSQFHSDMAAWCAHNNGDLLAKSWDHWCKSAITGSPCCNSQDDCQQKNIRLTSNALFGRSDPSPGESTWTHVLPNFQITVLRHVCHEVGIQSFPKEGNSNRNLGDERFGVEDEATGDFMTLLNSVRRRKVQEYLADKRNIHEVTVLSILLAIADRNLLYPLLGDPIRADGKPSKLDLLLDPEESKATLSGDKNMQTKD